MLPVISWTICGQTRISKGIQRNSQPGFSKEGRSPVEQELLWSLSVGEIKRNVYFRKICCQFIWHLFTFSGISMYLLLVFCLFWVLFFTLTRTVMFIAHCMTEYVKTSKRKHSKILSVFNEVTCDKETSNCATGLLWAGKYTNWRKIVEKTVRIGSISHLSFLFNCTITFFCQQYQGINNTLFS